jgi:hypothetical protein
MLVYLKRKFELDEKFFAKCHKDLKYLKSVQNEEHHKMKNDKILQQK